MLCGYGSNVPRMNNQGLTARITTQNITVAADGTFTFTVVANDLIFPAGTYYTITIRDDNGDIAQVNAYRFTSDNAGYNLNTNAPYDPNQNPPALPPLITNMLELVASSATPDFNGATYTAFRITLTGDVTSSAIVGELPGNLYTWIIQQDATGGHAFTWPPNVYNATPVDQDPNSITVQTFVVDQNNSMYPIAGGTYYA
jgi:hypothetical protein